MPDNDINLQANDDMLDDTDLTVPRGFLISLDSHGNYVPFFIKVRKEDIVYSDVINSNLYDNIINKFDALGSTYEHRMIDITKELEIKKDGWTFHIKPDGAFTASYVKTTDFVGWWQSHIGEIPISAYDKTEYLTHLSSSVVIPLPIIQTNESPILVGSFVPKTLNNNSEAITNPIPTAEMFQELSTQFCLTKNSDKPYYNIIDISVTDFNTIMLKRLKNYNNDVILTSFTLPDILNYIEHDYLSLNIYLEGKIDLSEFNIT